jgi:hypothetical protein
MGRRNDNGARNGDRSGDGNGSRNGGRPPIHEFDEPGPNGEPSFLDMVLKHRASIVSAVWVSRADPDGRAVHVGGRCGRILIEPLGDLDERIPAEWGAPAVYILRARETSGVFCFTGILRCASYVVGRRSGMHANALGDASGRGLADKLAEDYVDDLRGGRTAPPAPPDPFAAITAAANAFRTLGLIPPAAALGPAGAALTHDEQLDQFERWDERLDKMAKKRGGKESTLEVILGRGPELLDRLVTPAKEAVFALAGTKQEALAVEKLRAENDAKRLELWDRHHPPRPVSPPPPAAAPAGPASSPASPSTTTPNTTEPKK